MKLFVTLSVLFITISPVVYPQHSVGWRNIVPLRSTRSEVEKQLGLLDLSCQCYETDHEVIYISYSSGPCVGELPGWNVPANTVLSIRLVPQKKSLFLDLKLKKEDFIRTADDTATSFYANGTE